MLLVKNLTGRVGELAEAKTSGGSGLWEGSGMVDLDEL